MSISVEGMYASNVKSKFSNWFIPIERVEYHANSKFSHLFRQLYSNADISSVVSISTLSSETLSRLTGFMSGPNVTIENRATKLRIMIDKIGLSKFTFGQRSSDFLGHIVDRGFVQLSH